VGAYRVVNVIRPPCAERIVRARAGRYNS
jgi:hypothetical protein